MTKATRGLTYHAPTPAQQAVGLWVAGSGGMDKLGDGGCRERVLPGYAVVLVEDGGGWFDSRPSGRLRIAAPCLFWLLPGVAHSYWADPGWRERWYLFDGPLAGALRDTGAIAAADPLHPCPVDSPCHRAFERCWAASRDQGPVGPAAAAAALHELIVASQAIRLGYEPGGRPRDRLVAAAIGLIEAPGGDARSPEGIAAELAVPYSTLRRRFKAITGGSLRDHAIGCKLKRAKALLATTGEPVHAVAAASGFDDPYYFSRLFAKRVGCSPSEFRRTGRL